MTPEDTFRAARNRLSDAQVAMRRAESELIRAERDYREASQAWEIYRTSNDHLRKVQP